MLKDYAENSGGGTTKLALVVQQDLIIPELL
jgi:hypothetical protein